MKIKIICFGKLDKKFFIDSFDNYAKLISKFADLEVIELKEVFKYEIDKNIKINSNLLHEKIEKFSEYEVFVTNVSSKEYSSEDFSKVISENKNFKSGKILFVIGPSDGYSQEFKQKYQNKISFSKMTFPHQLFRIMLTEQIYRSFKINNNETYHK